MKNWAFKKFDGRVPRGDTKIGINKSGLIRLSSGFCDLTGITKYKYCVLYYDSTHNAIALKFTNTREDGVSAVTPDLKAATLSAKSFFHANKLDLAVISGRYDPQKANILSIGEVFIIELSTNGAIT